MSSKIYFRLSGSCIPVRGAKESIICDLNQRLYFAIPNILYDVLEVNSKNNYSIGQLKKYFKHEYNKGIDSFISLFENKQLGFWTSTPEVFRIIDFSFHSPCKISNSVIEMAHRQKG